jgi:hypothetical protein
MLVPLLNIDIFNILKRTIENMSQFKPSTPTRAIYFKRFFSNCSG